MGRYRSFLQEIATAQAARNDRKGGPPVIARSAATWQSVFSYVHTTPKFVRTSVGWGYVSAACRNYRLRTNSFLPTACRFAVGGGDVCERRLRREKRAKRSGRIKAIGKRAVPAQTEPLIQQIMSTPYRDARRYLCLRDGEEGVEVFLFCH